MIRPLQIWWRPPLVMCVAVCIQACSGDGAPAGDETAVSDSPHAGEAQSATLPATATSPIAIAQPTPETPTPHTPEPETPTPDPPAFVLAYIHGPVDSIYNAENQRLGTLCRDEPDSCFAENLDTTAVRLLPYWLDPGSIEPDGWLSARLRSNGRWPYAALVALGNDGTSSTVLDDMGDWGYGITLPLRELSGERFQPWLLAELGGWLSLEGGRGFSVLEGPFGLPDRLWYFQPITVTDASGGVTSIPAGVYMVLAVADGRVRLRPEIPQDMPCDPDVDSLPVEDVEVFEVPVSALLDDDGRPRVDVAYGRGC